MRSATAAFLLGTLLLPACTRLYYGAMERLGKEKRDLLVARVKEARQDQEEARQQFQSALEAFQAVTGFSGGDLEKTYHRLNKEHERCNGRAKEVRNRIRSIEKVSRDLFREWEKEIGEMSNRELRARSRRLLRETQQRYETLHRRMVAAEERMDPVLRAFNDKVLFLKHNLNAQAIQSLKKDAAGIDGDVTALVKDLNASIAEADAFIAAMTAAPGVES